MPPVFSEVVSVTTFKKKSMLKYFLGALLACLISNPLLAQRVFVGSAHSMPVIDAFSHQPDTVITGFYNTVVNWVDKSADGSFLYAGTQYFQPVRKLFKYNTTTYARVAEADVTSYVWNLEVSDDDQFLFYSYQQKIYKASAQDLTLLDSMGGFFGVNAMKIISNTEAVCTVLGTIYKIDLTTFTLLDSIEGLYLMPGINTNHDRSKIYATKIGPNENGLVVVDAATFSLDTIVALPGMQGDAVDAISTADGTQILVISVGSTLSTGGLRVFNSADYSQIYSTEHAGGGGRMTINSNGEVWIPRQTSKKIMIYNPVAQSVTDSIDFGVFSNAPPFKAIFTDVVTTTPEYQNPQVNIYPNPTTDLLQIDGIAPDAKLTLFGLDGRIIHQWERSNQLSLKDLPAGFYLLEIQEKKGRTLKRVMKY
jgi:hypothetical protein